MEIIIYTQKDNPQKDTLLKRISQVSNLTYVMAFDFDNLFRLVKSKVSDQVIIVFFISSAKELDFLILNRRHLFNSRYILILPSEEESIVSKGLSLYPRYIAHRAYGFKDVAAILDKMIRNTHTRTTDSEPQGDDLQ